MGRSQVERNKRLGRPGEKGGRGKKQSSKTQDRTQTELINLGDNSFRYQYEDKGFDRTTNNDVDGSEWDYSSSANVYGASHHVVDIPSYDDVPNTDYSYGMFEIDIGKLSACIDEMKTCEWMRLDNDRISKIFDDRFSGFNEDKKTLSEWNASSEAAIAASSFRDIHVTPTTTIKEETSSPKPIRVDMEKKKTSESDEEDNLQDWLDDMIDT